MTMHPESFGRDMVKNEIVGLFVKIEDIKTFLRVWHQLLAEDSVDCNLLVEKIDEKLMDEVCLVLSDRFERGEDGERELVLEMLEEMLYCYPQKIEQIELTLENIYRKNNSLDPKILKILSQVAIGSTLNSSLGKEDGPEDNERVRRIILLFGKVIINAEETDQNRVSAITNISALKKVTGVAEQLRAILSQALEMDNSKEIDNLILSELMQMGKPDDHKLGTKIENKIYEISWREFNYEQKLALISDLRNYADDKYITLLEEMSRDNSESNQTKREILRSEALNAIKVIQRKNSEEQT